MLLTNATVATMHGPKPYGLLHQGAIVIEQETVGWVGRLDELPSAHRAEEHIDLDGRLVTPGLIDCHTHIVHGGQRAREFELRLGGASYADIAKSGGGILATVKNTREATSRELLDSALRRVDALLAEGVTTLEIKSGYGLDIDTELNMLRAARAIAQQRPVTVKTSFLGAHAIPPDYAGHANDYLMDVCLPALDAAHKENLVDAVDGFCEGIAFSTTQIECLFEHARALGLPVKLHAEQLSNLGGAALAARYGALSADHLEYAIHDDVAAMAAAGTVAVMLPGALYTLRETQLPPIDAFRQQGVPMAVATDCNPGSSPLNSILLAMNMACTLIRMTPEEALAGVTRHAARALGLKGVGIIQAGMRADLAIWDVELPAELAYRIGFNPLHKRIFGGVL